MKNRSKLLILKNLGMDKPYHLPRDGRMNYGSADEARAVSDSEYYRKHMDFDLQLAASSGRAFKFYGAHTNMFKIDSMVLEAIEDPSDGYRSYLHSVVITKEDAETPGGFFDTPLASVKITETDARKLKAKELIGEYYGDFEGWTFVDVDDGHVWLIVGTANTDDYYPSFTFDYRPKKES